MAVYRANNRSLFTTNPRFGFQAYEYNNVNAGQKYVQVEFTASGNWTRPNNISYIEILMVGGGGGGGGGANASSGNRKGGGGGGGSIVYGKMYVANFNDWRIVVGAGGTGGYGSSDCGNYLWGHIGRPSVFGPLNSYTPDETNSFAGFGITASGGGGGAHPCGGQGIWSATQGGSGTRQSSTNGDFGGNPSYGAWGKGGAAASGDDSFGGGGGSMTNTGSGQTGGSGPTIWGYSNLGAGGSGGGSGGNNGGYGRGGNGNQNGSQGGTGGSGIVVIRYYV